MRTPSWGCEGLSTPADLWPVVASRPHGAAPADFSAGPWLSGQTRLRAQPLLVRPQP